MVALFGGIFISLGLADLLRAKGKARWLGFFLFALLLIEFLPKPIPLTRVDAPVFVRVLKGLPKNYAFMDSQAVFAPPAHLAYQTIHEVPIAHGYISRVPLPVELEDEHLSKLAEPGKFRVLCNQYGFRYQLVKDSFSLRSELPSQPLIHSGGVSLFDLGQSCKRLDLF